MVLSGGARINRAGTRAPATCKHCDKPFPKLPNGEEFGYKHYAILTKGSAGGKKGEGKGKDKRYLGNASPNDSPKGGNKGRPNMDQRFEKRGKGLRSEMLGAIQDVARHVTGGQSISREFRPGKFKLASESPGIHQASARDV